LIKLNNWLKINLQLMNVLLAENSFENALMTRKLLEKLGCQVDHVENGRLAADKARNKSYNLILMDLQMPVLDGDQSTEEIRKPAFQHQ